MFAFAAKLDGGLDCRTGEFRAQAADGRWGVLDLEKDPNEPPAVVEPAIGLFDGNLVGSVMQAVGKTIEGTWNLYDHDNDLRCMGPFSVSLQK